MLRITELKLPLDHSDEDLRAAILQRLGIADAELLDFSLFKRSYDARKKSSELLFIYTLDVSVRDEAALLAKFADDRQIGPTPDMRYKFVGHAPEQLALAAVQTLGPRAQEWAAQTRADYPTADAAARAVPGRRQDRLLQPAGGLPAPG